ncbi:Metalloendopeptidase [Aphelenchoides besseyi]|nr:Metalloendopeptidase [Aphelenchoides besseyi]
MVDRNVKLKLAARFQGINGQSIVRFLFFFDESIGSVMHYADTDTARGVVTILAKDRIYQHTMGNNVAPSFLDILEMNIYYNCVHQQSSRQLRCNNGGFQKPTDPNRCVCPTGFGGSDCSQLQKGEFGADAECGQVIMVCVCLRCHKESFKATNVYQTLSNRVSAQSNKLADRHAACFWHIKAPKGQRVQMKILKIYGACSAGCFYAGLEIKFRNFVRTGARICCQFDLANMGYLESEGNLAIVLAYSSFRSFGFKLKFRAVGNPSEKCVDEQSNCNSLVNLCSHPRYYKLMTTQCAKTCMRCVSTSETPVTPIRNLEPDPEIASPDLPECGERDECSSWSNNGFCDSNFFTVHMKKQYCGQTCRLCKP